MKIFNKLPLVGAVVLMVSPHMVFANSLGVNGSYVMSAIGSEVPEKNTIDPIAVGGCCPSEAIKEEGEVAVGGGGAGELLPVVPPDIAELSGQPSGAMGPDVPLDPVP